MTIEHILLHDIEESQRALNGPNDDTIYRRDHSKRIELINWVLHNGIRYAFGYIDLADRFDSPESKQIR